MQIHTKAHYDLMAAFEAQYPGFRLDKEPKEKWAKGWIYQHGELNQLFLAFRRGVAYGQAVEMQGAA